MMTPGDMEREIHRLKAETRYLLAVVSMVIFALLMLALHVLFP